MTTVTKKMILSALFLALVMILPMFIVHIPGIGRMLLPMHIPVLLCGFLVGWPYGLLVGLIGPLLRSFAFGMPPLFPTAIAMTFELAVYGAASGFIYNKFSKKNIASTYIALISAMILGRIISGAANIILYGITQDAYTWEIFLSASFIQAIPGIIFQLIAIPPIVLSVRKASPSLQAAKV